MKLISAPSNESHRINFKSPRSFLALNHGRGTRLVGVFAALLLSVLFSGCASTQAVDDLEALVASYNAEVERNKVEQVEILSELQRLDGAGESQSTKAVALRDQLVLLEKEQERQEKVLADFEAVVLSNQEEIEKLKRHETGRSAAVERLNQSFEEISSDTNKKIRDIETPAPVPEGE